MKIDKSKVGKFADLGERFLAALKYAKLDHLTYRQLAPMMDVTPPVIGRLLHGQQSLSHATASKITGLTGVDHNWFMTGEGSMLKAVVGKYSISIKGLSDQQIEQVDSLIKTMQRHNTQGA